MMSGSDKGVRTGSQGLLPPRDEVLARFIEEGDGIPLGPVGDDCPEGKPHPFVADEFIDPATGCLNGLVDHEPNVTANIIATGFSLGGTANSFTNLVNLGRHPLDWASGNFETELLTSQDPESYAVLNEERDGLSSLGTIGLVGATVFLLGLGASKNTDASGRGSLASGILIAATTKVPVYLSGGSIAAQYRNYTNRYGLTPVEAYGLALSPVGWYHSVVHPEEQFRQYIYGDMISTNIMEGVVSIWTQRAGHILGQTGFATVMPSGMSSLPGAGFVASHLPPAVTDLYYPNPAPGVVTAVEGTAVEGTAAAEGAVVAETEAVSPPPNRLQRFMTGVVDNSRGVFPFINQVLVDKAIELDALTEQIVDVDNELGGKKTELRELREGKQSKLTKGRGIARLEREIAELEKKRGDLDKNTRALRTFFEKLEQETGFPAMDIVEARRLAQKDLTQRLKDVEADLIKTKEEIASMATRKPEDVEGGGRARKKELATLKRKARSLEHFKEELERIKGLRKEEIDLAALRKEANELRGNITDLGQEVRSAKGINARRAKLKALNKAVARLNELDKKILDNEVHFVRHNADVRRLAWRALTNGIRQGAFRTLPETGLIRWLQREVFGLPNHQEFTGSATLETLDSARSGIMKATNEERALYARSSFGGKLWHGSWNSLLRRGRIAATAFRLTGMWTTVYGELVLMYHYVWGKDWKNSFQSSRSIFITMPWNQPWVNMLKNAFGVKNIMSLVESLPSTMIVNLYWSRTRWGKDVMVQRCSNAVRALAESTDPKYQETIRDRVDVWYAMANKEERDDWDKQCGLKPSHPDLSLETTPISERGKH